MSRISTAGHKEKTVTSFRQRKEKPEVLCGWKTPKSEDETDITHWAKKRQLQDSRADTTKQTPLKWDKYLCTIIKKCRALESVQMFIDDSLSVSLKPTPSHLEREPTRIKLKHANSMPVLKVDKVSKIAEEPEKAKDKSTQETSSIKEVDETVSETNTSSLEQCNAKDKTSNGDSDNAINRTKTSSDEGTQVSNTENSELAETDEVEVESGDGSTERTELSTLSTKQSDTTAATSQDKPPPKFGYTRSNITLNIHPLFMPMSNANKQFKSEEIQTQSDNEYDDSEDNTEFETVKKLNFKGSLANPLKRQPTEKRVLHTTNLTQSSVLPDYVSKRSLLPGKGAFSSRSESNISRMQDDSQSMAVTQVSSNSGQALNGMSIASLKSGKRVQSAITDIETDRSVRESQEDKNMSQKQVMLVLKKVTLKDDLGDLYKEDKQENPFYQTHALLSSHNQKYDLPTTGTVNAKPKKSVHREQDAKTPRSSRHKAICFPIGELLPAVDSSIRNSMPARQYRSLDHPGLDRDIGNGGKENALLYEDGMSMMKQGIEIIRVKSNILGPPAFRAPNGKSPLQRAKENTTKRTQSQLPLSATQIAEVTDFSRSFWKSSAGSLYSNPGVRSRPGSRNEDEARTHSSRLSKKWKAENQSTDVTAARDLQNVSQTLSSRLRQLSRQRGADTTEMVVRESVS